MKAKGGLHEHAVADAKQLYDQTSDFRYAVLAIGAAMAVSNGTPPDWAVAACAQYTSLVARVSPRRRRELRSTEVATLLAQAHEMENQEPAFDPVYAQYKNVLARMVQTGENYAQACLAEGLLEDTPKRKAIDRISKRDRGRSVLASKADGEIVPADFVESLTDRAISVRLESKYGPVS